MIEKIIIWNPSSDRIDTHDEDFSGTDTKNDITMREIKFRMWHNDTRCMYADTGLSSLGLNDAIEKALKSEYVIMQFTGLKDKNGKEIYEGDIGTIYDPYTRSQHTDQIIWDDNNCRFAVKNTYIDFDFLVNDEMIVVGNIYENPDLL